MLQGSKLASRHKWAPFGRLFLKVRRAWGGSHVSVMFFIFFFSFSSSEVHPLGEHPAIFPIESSGAPPEGASQTFSIPNKISGTFSSLRHRALKEAPS